MGADCCLAKGFGHPGYADSLIEFGTPRQLPLCNGWILERPIPGFSYRDAMGCYPLFVCEDWSQLQADLKVLENDLVSLSLVADPFGRYDLNLLNECFDIVIPFKEHHVADLSKPINTIVSAHHRQYARKALRHLIVDISHNPLQFIDEWLDLYGALAKRFNIEGIRAFTKSAFAKQLTIPGAVMFRALYQGNPIAAHLAYAHEDVCYGHLAGVTQAGQDHMASYALYWTEIQYLADKAQWMDWGGGAGIKNNKNDGLAQFKRGWSTGTRTTYFCGRIFNRERYDEIVKVSGNTETDYFPAYRKGEFG